MPSVDYNKRNYYKTTTKKNMLTNYARKIVKGFTEWIFSSNQCSFVSKPNAINGKKMRRLVWLSIGIFWPLIR